MWDNECRKEGFKFHQLAAIVTGGGGAARTINFRAESRNKAPSKKAWARSVLVDVEQERQDGIEGDWRQESPCKEELEPVKHSSDLRFEGLLMRRACCAGRSGDWENCLEEFFKDGRLSVWASVKVSECCNEVEAGDEGRLSIAQDILRESADFLGENHRTK